MNAAETLTYIQNKFELDMSVDMPVQISGFLRSTFPSIFHELGFKVGVEVGTYAGEYAEVICKGILNLKLYCVDQWMRISGSRHVGSWRQVNRSYSHACERLEKYNCSLIKKTSVEAAKDFLPDSMDFVYIDADHDYDPVIQDITAWSVAVRPGGIIAGHDFTSKNWHGCYVRKAVFDYTNEHKIRPWFVTDRTPVNEAAAKGDDIRSWFWVKQ